MQSTQSSYDAVCISRFGQVNRSHLHTIELQLRRSYTHEACIPGPVGDHPRSIPGGLRSRRRQHNQDRPARADDRRYGPRRPGVQERRPNCWSNQTNAAGGINGQQIELFVEDDKGDPKESALVADRLISKKVIAVIGGYNSTATEPASAIYNKAGVLHITPGATATRLTEHGYNQFFRVCFLDDRRPSSRPTS